MATGRAHVVYLAKEDEPGDELGDARIWGYEEKTVRRPLHPPTVPSESMESHSAGPTHDTSSNRNGNAATRAPDEYEEYTIRVPKGKQVGWKRYADLYFDPHASLAIVNKFAEEAGEHPIPLREKALGKRLAELGVLVNSEPGRNTARLPIDGVKRDVFNILTWRFVEFLEPDRDRLTASYEEELLAYERYITQQRERHKARDLATKRATEFMVESVMKILRPC
jgi:hypothetical protein